MSKSNSLDAIRLNSRRARHSRRRGRTLPCGSSRYLEAGDGKFPGEGRVAAEPAELGADAVEERVQGQARSFHADNFDDFVDPSWEEAAFATVEAAWPVAVDDEVDLAEPVECLLGLDAGARGEREADEVAEGVFGG